MIVGGYILNLSCDAKGCDVARTFSAQTGAACRREALRKGWHFIRNIEKPRVVCQQCWDAGNR